jgi:serine/threonine protein kinase
VSELGLLVPFIDGDRFDRWKPKSACSFIDACVDISDGLAHLHNVGWIHGEVSARQIMVDDHGAATLIGFGGSTPVGDARPPAEGPHETLRAPEVIRGETRTARTDIFGIGAAMYGQLVGTGLVRSSLSLANAGDVDLQLWHQRVEENLSQYCSVRSMRTLVARCLDPDPRGRPINAEVVGRELRSMRGVAAVRFDGQCAYDVALAA